jgi:hypothetical protein
MVRRIFRHDGAFVLVTRDNDIKNKEVASIFSILIPAALETHFPFPIFVQLSEPQYFTFQGHYYSGRIHTSFSSRTEWRPDDSLVTSDSISTLFQRSFPVDASSINLDVRVHSQFTSQVFQGTPLEFRLLEFYSWVNCDPVRRLHICSDLPHTSRAPRMAIYVELADVVESPSPLSRFIDSMLNNWHTARFSDLVTNGATHFARSEIARLFEECPVEISDEKSLLKAAPHNSLLERLVVQLVQLREPDRFAALWLEFVNEIRRRASSKVVIPGVGLSGPQFENCLIFQKLQMLNVCINGIENVALTPSQPMHLLSGQTMVFPTTTMIAVNTEDQIEEVRHLLEMNADDVRQRALLQSRPLQREMLRFWEVNPTAVFADFIHWYSPGDFDRATGEVSPRMSADGSLWRSLWDDVVSGKELDEQGLFNPVEQAEMALDYLYGLLPLELIGDLIPVAFAAASFEVAEAAPGQMTAVDQAIARIDRALQTFHVRVEEATEKLPRDVYVHECQAVAQTIEAAGLVIAAANSLAKKFPGCEAAVKQLMECREFRVTGEGEHDAIQAMMAALGRGFDADLRVAREFLVSGQIGGGDEEASQQHLYVAHLDEGIVIALVVREPL